MNLFTFRNIKYFKTYIEGNCTNGLDLGFNCVFLKVYYGNYLQNVKGFFHIYYPILKIIILRGK